MDIKTALENIHNQDRASRQQAFTVIRHAGEEALPRLIAVLYETHDLRQEIAIGLLWMLHREYGLRHPDEAKAIIHAIKSHLDGNPMVVQDGFGLLYDLADPTVFDDLVVLLTHDDPIVRGGAAEALGNAGDKRATKYLLPLLDDPEVGVKVDTAFVLGNKGDAQAVPALTRKLSDKQWCAVSIIGSDGQVKEGLTVADAAAIALRRIGTEEAIRAVKKWEHAL